MTATDGKGGAAQRGPTPLESQRDEPPTKTVVISWVEECHHEVTVRVPIDFDPWDRDLGNGLAELTNDGFEWLERTQIAVQDAADDPAAEYFDPPTYGEGF